MVIDGDGPHGSGAPRLDLSDYARQRLADVRVGATGTMWGVFVEDIGGLPSGLVMPLDAMD